MDKTKDGFNKLQWSSFVGSDQYVVRSNDMGEFIDLIGEVEDFIKKAPKNASTMTKETPETQKPTMLPSQALGVCSKCGAPNKLSKQGKVYCSATCWLKNSGEKQY